MFMAMKEKYTRGVISKYNESTCTVWFLRNWCTWCNWEKGDQIKQVSVWETRGWSTLEKGSGLFPIKRATPHTPKKMQNESKSNERKSRLDVKNTYLAVFWCSFARSCENGPPDLSLQATRTHSQGVHHTHSTTRLKCHLYILYMV